MIRKFTHYVLISWAITMGAMAMTGVLYMLYGLVFLDFASRVSLTLGQRIYYLTPNVNGQ